MVGYSKCQPIHRRSGIRTKGASHGSGAYPVKTLRNNKESFDRRSVFPQAPPIGRGRGRTQKPIPSRIALELILRGSVVPLTWDIWDIIAAHRRLHGILGGNASHRRISQNGFPCSRHIVPDSSIARMLMWVIRDDWRVSGNSKLFSGNDLFPVIPGICGNGFHMVFYHVLQFQRERFRKFP